MMRKILLAGNNADKREALCAMLSAEYEVLESADSEAALCALRENDGHISAVLLSGAESFALLRKLRADPAFSALPVVAATDDKASGLEALALGANDFVIAPFDPVFLLHALRNAIALCENAAIVSALQKDKLTGLYNREAFFDMVAAMIREKPAGYFVMACFDIDNFKLINDQYGADEGDRLLRQIGVAIDKSIRAIGGVCCRISADNFALLYPAGEQNFNYVNRLWSSRLIPSDARSSVAFSVGRYIVTDPSLSANMLYDRAYIAKGSVKGRYDKHIAYFDESMRERLLRDQMIINEMDTALRLRQFEAWFQPQFNHSTGALIGAEALSRWRHPSRGLIPPKEFVPVFEQNGFIYELDKFVWEETCACLRRWIDAGLDPLPVSVNISRYDIFRADLCETIGKLLKKYDIPVRLLRLEITESAFSKSSEQIIAVVEQLMELGFTVEIDDFGSGYSSLNTLKDVPADVLKLDMRFLESNENSQRGGNILESIVRMAKWLNMSVIAEGVETIEQADFLKSIGCSYVQGFLYAEAMPAAQYETLFIGAGKEHRLLKLKTVENLDNNVFWDPRSIDTLIFNSYIGGACIFEYYKGKIELLRANDKYAQVVGSSGMTIEDALKLDWSKHLDAENFALMDRALERSIESGSDASEEFVFLDLPGCAHKTYLRSMLRVIAAADKRYLVYCTNENITAQREAEQKEKQALAQIQTIMNDAGSGITAAVMENGEHRFLLTNARYYEILKYTREQYDAEVKNPFDLIHPDDRDFMRELAITAYATGEPAQADYRVICRGGEVRYVRSILSATHFAGVKEDIQLCVFTDVTAEKTAERALRETDENLRFLSEAAHELLAQPDSERGLDSLLHKLLLYFNGSRAYIFEMNDEKRVARNSYEVCAGDVESQKDRLSNLSYDLILFWFEAFEQYGYISIESVDAMDESHSEEKALLKELGVRSLIAVPLRRDGRLIGFIGIDDPAQQHTHVNRLVALGDYVAVMLTRRDLDARIVNDRRIMQAFMNDTPGGFVRMHMLNDGTLVPVYMNDGFCRMMNMERDALMRFFGRDATAGVHPDDMELIRDFVRELLKFGEAKSARYRLQRGNGEYVYLIVFGRLIKDESGELFLNAYFTDANDALDYREMLSVALRAVTGSSSNLAYVKDKQYRYVCCSRPFALLTKLSSEDDVVGKTDYDLFEKAIADKIRGEDVKIIENHGGHMHYEEFLPVGEDPSRYVGTSKYPLLDSKGNVIGIYCVTRDITKAHELDSRLSLLTDNIPCGLATYHYSPGRLDTVYFNDGFAKLLGYTREEYQKICEVDPLNLVFSEDLPGLLSKLDEVLSGKGAAEYVFRVRLKSGGYKWINNKAILTDKNEEYATINAVLLDVTALQESVERLRISEEENRLAAEHSGNVICRYSIEERCLSINPETAARRKLDCLYEDVPVRQIRDGVVSPDSADACERFFKDILEGRESGLTSFQLKLRGQWRWVRAHSSTIFNTDKKPVSAVVSFDDITEQLEQETVYKKWQQSLQDKPPESYTLYRCNLSRDNGFEAPEGCLLHIEFPAEVKSFNERTAAYCRQYVFEEDKSRFSDFLNAYTLLVEYYRGKRSDSLEFRENLPKNEVRWLRLSVDLVEYPNSSDIEAYLMFENIDDKKREELLTIERAEKDPLTGVLNRGTFTARVEKLIAQSGEDSLHALLMLDLDGFKLVNDSFGHTVGDQALIDVAELMRSALRKNDLLGRLGGDEFLILLSDIPNEAVAAAKAKRICAMLRKSYSAEIQISASVGIVICPRDGRDFDTLYKKADAALYHVKGSGKNNFCFYREDMNDQHLEPETGPNETSGWTAAKKRRMLIVDDSNMDHAFLNNIFKREFIIEKAKDGPSALIRLRHYGSAVSVVLLDLMMPGMNGFEVLQELHDNPELRTIPVVVVSASNDRETSLKAIRAGASDFVTKPVDPDLLRIRVQSAISKAENERLRAQNSYLELASSELEKYKMFLEHAGVALIEYDWVKGEFSYDASIGEYIAGIWNERKMWHILLSDRVADVNTVREMQELVHAVAEDRERTEGSMSVALKTPAEVMHVFRMNVYKRTNEYQLADKLIITLIDTGEFKSAQS